MYWSITLPEKLLRQLSRWQNKQVFYYEPLTGEGMDLLTDEQVQDIDRFYEKKKFVLFATALHTTTRMIQKKMQSN